MNKYFSIFQAMCHVLNPVALSGSTVCQDQCRRITALIRQHTSLSQLDFFHGAHFSLVGNLSRKWFGSLSVGIVVVYGRSLSYYSVAHQLPGPSWQILHLRCIPRFCWKKFPIKTSGDIESRAPSVTIWNRKWANLVLFIDNWNRIAPNFALVETPNSNDCKSP